FSVITGSVMSSSVSSSTVTVVITLSSGGVQATVKSIGDTPNFALISASMSLAMISKSSSPAVNSVSFPFIANDTKSSSSLCSVSGISTPASPTIFSGWPFTSILNSFIFPLKGFINVLNESKLPVKSISISVIISSTVNVSFGSTVSGTDIVGVTFISISKSPAIEVLATHVYSNEFETSSAFAFSILPTKNNPNVKTAIQITALL